jgi:hypothetical protein
LAIIPSANTDVANSLGAWRIPSVPLDESRPLGPAPLALRIGCRHR